MSKQIIPIKCPQCGATEKATLGPNQYQCVSCQTEYHIDNGEEININIQSNTEAVPLTDELIKKLGRQGNPDTAKFNRKMNARIAHKYTPLHYVGAVLFAFALYGGLGIVSAGSFDEFMNIVANPNPQAAEEAKAAKEAQQQAAQQASQANQNSQLESKFEKVEGTTDVYYSTSIPAKEIISSVQTDSPVEYSVIKKYVYSNDAYPDKHTFQVKDIISGEIIKSYSLDELLAGRDFKAAAKDFNNRIDTLQMVKIDNDHVYLIVFEDQILQIDPKTYEMNDVTETLLGKFSELELGIASIKGDRSDDDAFEIKSSDNKLYHYYPLGDKLFTDEQQRYGIKDDQNIQSKEVIYFAGMFNEPRQLMKETIKFNTHAPYKNPKPRSPLNKTGEDITPNRVYIEPKLLTYNAEQIVIVDQISAKPNSGYKIEALDRKTGNVLWSLEYADKPDLIPLKSGYLIYQTTREQQSASIVNFDGSIKQKDIMLDLAQFK